MSAGFLFTPFTTDEPACDCRRTRYCKAHGAPLSGPGHGTCAHSPRRNSKRKGGCLIVNQPLPTASQREQLLASAADWMLLLRDPSVSPAEIRRWMAWCDASAEHQQAFNEMERLWQQLGDVDARPIQPAALAADG